MIPGCYTALGSCSGPLTFLNSSWVPELAEVEDWKVWQVHSTMRRPSSSGQKLEVRTSVRLRHLSALTLAAHQIPVY